MVSHLECLFAVFAHDDCTNVHQATLDGQLDIGGDSDAPKGEEDAGEGAGEGQHLLELIGRHRGEYRETVGATPTP